LVEGQEAREMYMSTKYRTKLDKSR